VQDHRVVRERAGRAGRRPPVVRVGLKGLEQGRRLAVGSDGERFQGLAQRADRVAAEALLPVVFDRAQELKVAAPGAQARGSEAGDLPAARGRIRLLDGESDAEQDAQGPADGFLGDAGQERQVAQPRSLRAEDAQQVGADRERRRGSGLVIQGEPQQYPGQQRRQRQGGDVGRFGPGRQGRIWSPAEQGLAEDREAVGQSGIELACDRFQRAAEPADRFGAEPLPPALLDEPGQRQPGFPRPQAPRGGASRRSRRR